MNKILFFALLVSNIALSQKPTKELIMSLKYDDPAKLIIAAGEANLNNCYMINETSYSLLAMAIKSNAKNCLKRLLKENVNIEKVCETKTPLLYAVKYGKLEMLKLLVESGANYNIVTSKGRTAKDYAKKYKRNEVLEYLISLEEK
jgi:ankyrin repeat protein